MEEVILKKHLSKEVYLKTLTTFPLPWMLVMGNFVFVENADKREINQSGVIKFSLFPQQLVVLFSFN